jgi:hypothetical protein
MSGRMTISARSALALAGSAFVLAGCGATTGDSTGAIVIPGGVNYHFAAAAACGSSIGQFETIINSDAETGNLNKGVHRRIVAELASVKASCAAGRDADASRALAALKARHGYR